MENPKRRSGERRVGPIRQDERRSKDSDEKANERRTGDDRRAAERRSGEERRDPNSPTVD